MNLDTAIPLRFYLNLGPRDDRRANTERVLFEAGIEAERLPGIDHRWLQGRSRGYSSSQLYACSLSHRLAVRKAKQRKAPAVLIFEDDVVLDQDFRSKVEKIEVPDDWDLLFFGCTHQRRPTAIKPGLVQAHANFDNHCYAVRDRAYDQVLSALRPPPRNSGVTLQANDLQISSLLRHLKGYAFFPNLAWQAVSHSDILGKIYSNYNQYGTQVNHPGIIDGIAAETHGISSWKGTSKRRGEDEQDNEVTGHPNPHVGLLFLTRGNLLCQDRWTQYLDSEEHPPKVFAHVKNPSLAEWPPLKAGLIKELIPTEWARVSLVRATLLLLKEALKDSSLSHFVLLSESCLPTKPYAALREFLQTDSRSWIAHEGFHQVLSRDAIKASRFKTLPHVPYENQRWQSQWMLLNRETAELLVKNDLTHLFEEVFAPDETYFMTVLSMMGYPMSSIINEQMTWTQWEPMAGHPNLYESTSGIPWSKALRAPGFFARKFNLTGDAPPSE